MRNAPDSKPVDDETIDTTPIKKIKIQTRTVNFSELERRFDQERYSTVMTLPELASYLRTLKGVGRIYFKSDGRIYLYSYTDPTWMVRVTTPETSVDCAVTIHVENLQFIASRQLQSIRVSGHYGDSFDVVESEMLTILTHDVVDPSLPPSDDRRADLCEYSIRFKNRAKTSQGRAKFTVEVVGDGLVYNAGRTSDASKRNFYPMGIRDDVDVSGLNIE